MQCTEAGVANHNLLFLFFSFLPFFHCSFFLFFLIDIPCRNRHWCDGNLGGWEVGKGCEFCPGKKSEID